MVHSPSLAALQIRFPSFRFKLKSTSNFGLRQSYGLQIPSGLRQSYGLKIPRMVGICAASNQTIRDSDTVVRMFAPTIFYTADIVQMITLSFEEIA